MISKELTKNISIWTSNEEHELLTSLTEPRIIESFPEREQTIIEQLIRKNLLVTVKGKYATYIYPI